MRSRTIALAAALLCIGVAPVAEAQEVGPYLGTFETKGRQGWRKVAVKLEFTRAEDGTLSASRTYHLTGRRYRQDDDVTWTTNDVKVEGDTLKVVYRMTTDGVPVYVNESGGLVTALGDSDSGSATDADGNAVEADKVNVFEATYSLDGSTIKEQVRNTKKLKPEDYWRNAKTKGEQLTSTDPDAERKRIKLGETIQVKNGIYTVVVPTDGTLTLELSGGSLTLESPSGDAAPVTQDGEKYTLEVPHENPVLGIYKIKVEGAGADEALEASFVQDGRIDPRIRPWSSHTYYPIYEFGYGTSENENTLFKKDGALEKYDRALGLEGKDSAIWWERGTDYRTGFGFERGHYTKKQSPSEKKAEEEWHADLDRDGVMETGDAAEAFKRYDANEDGKVDEAEAKEQLYKDQIDLLWKNYDNNDDGKITSDEIFASFVTKYDEDSSGDISPEEWDKALRAAYAQLLEDRTKKALEDMMSNDADGDGFIVEADLPAPGQVDFQDSGDVDGDFNSFFDRDNIKITTKSGETHFGNKVEEDGDKLKLFKGRKSDELVVELKKDDVEKREDGIADGDFDDSYSVGWWGHCNAWALASIVFRKPAEEFEYNGVKLTIRDQKGILVELGMGDSEESTFWWQSFGGDEIPPAKYAAGFHEHMHRWLRVEQKGMMADMDLKDPNNNLNFQVWNYPLLGYVATIKESEGDDPYVLDVSCKIEKGSYSDEDSSSTKTITYKLHFNSDGSLNKSDESKGDWTTERNGAKGYIRYLIHPFRFTRRGSSGNPKVTQEQLEKLFGERLKYNRIEDIEAEDAAAGGLDSGPATPPADTSGN